MDQPPSAATLPRGFRYADHLPRTPEPFAETEEAQIPSPPRPRLRLKRRNVSHLAAPTQNFLASVAAADVPIPSVEEPESSSLDLTMDDPLPSLERAVADEENTHLSVKPRGRTITTPKTPAPGIVPSLSPRRYPNWTIDSSISSVESTPDRESSRPSTSRSTQTSDSLFSRLSQLSDFEQCISPDAAEEDGSVFGPVGEDRLPAEPTDRRRRAPWTKAMSTHLWATYVLYLQDPKVTPFRMGKSCIPPHGVCLRVAREAKRSWKGSRNSNADNGKKSGSSTPTAESCGAFIQWPHTCAATRAHLRELCRVKAASFGMRNLHCISRSPTPFTQAAARHWNRRSTPGQRTAFATQDMSKSLALSAADTMQPDGPLAQLAGATSSSSRPADLPVSSGQQQPTRLLGTFEGEPSFAERRRLGSPFSAQSYGPSSSASLAAALGLSTPGMHRQTHTIGPRRTLQSPVRLSRSGTQKRKNRQSNEPRKRPSLGSDTWLDPASATGSMTETTQEPLFSSTTTREHDELFIPRSPRDPLSDSSISMSDVGRHLAPPVVQPPPRLGSPFTGGSASFSFPNRLHHPGGLDAIAPRRPFATVQQHQGLQQPATRSDLASRLAYIDRRLKEFNRNGRHRSPQ